MTTYLIIAVTLLALWQERSEIRRIWHEL